MLSSLSASYYASKKRGAQGRKTRDQELKALVAEIHASFLCTYGAPRIHEGLAQARGIRVGRGRVARPVKELRIEDVRRRKKGKKVRKASYLLPAPGPVKRDFSASRPGELFPSDITCIPTFKGWLYLAAITWVCTRRCCGFQVRDDLSSDLVTCTLRMAVALRRSRPGTIHHSEKGKPLRVLIFRKDVARVGNHPPCGEQG